MLTHLNTEPIRPPRTVLLGANGFLSRELRQQLEAAGNPYVSIGSSDVDLTEAGSIALLLERLHPDDSVVMLAALTPDKGRDVNSLMRNLRMGEHVSTALAARPVCQFVYISSDGVYDARNGSLLNESSSCEPTDLYTAMHITRELMFRDTCKTAKIPLCIVRPCAIYGAGDTHNSYGPNRFIRSALKDGKITLFGGGEETRDHVHVSDVASVIRLCINHGSTGTINAVSGRAVCFREVADLIANACGNFVNIECLSRSGPITHRSFDNTALVRAFPTLQVTPLPNGISTTVDKVRLI